VRVRRPVAASTSVDDLDAADGRDTSAFARTQEVPAVEVKIGVLHTAREIVLDSPHTPEEVEQTVAAALKSVDGQLVLTDDRGRKVIVPANLIAYVDIAQADTRRVGFANG
jgi:Protein of unknown function (DUF3107)